MLSPVESRWEWTLGGGVCVQRFLGQAVPRLGVRGCWAGGSQGTPDLVATWQFRKHS